ncbi:hypothetical protein Bphyt_1194 [Paraburkholderia phytofirmans PsJN]|uniref:Uncharacterized protein n=1 Tax=Paraburkholderia phytofirmans (strain DSM 17436 / LMG 22146 / PsJN) TaxID=398527 RepID=B2T1Z8_PARPJ|nr:hypothetical protein Bphyt_1194 [Paraburkholderia phytofirmans PsJN]
MIYPLLRTLRISLPLFLAWHPIVYAQSPSTSCITRTHAVLDQQHVRYTFTNNCGVCVRMVLVAMKDNAPLLPGGMLTQPTPPGGTFNFTQSNNGQVGTYETVVSAVQGC